MANKVRIGVLGAGRIGQLHIAPIWCRLFRVLRSLQLQTRT